MRLQQTGGAVKRTIIYQGVGYSAPNTTQTLYRSTNYDLANSPIIESYISAAKVPYGFPLDVAKWRVECLGTPNNSQASPVTETWYNKGGFLMIPAGRWRVGYAAELEVTKGSAGALAAFATLSPAANSEANKEATTRLDVSSRVSMVIVLLAHCAGSGDRGDRALTARLGKASSSAITFKESEHKTRIKAMYL